MIPHEGPRRKSALDARGYASLLIASIMGGLATGFRPPVRDREGYKSAPPIPPVAKVLLPERVVPRRRGKRIDPALATARVVAQRRAEKRSIGAARKARKMILGIFGRLCVKHRVDPANPSLAGVRGLAFRF